MAKKKTNQIITLPDGISEETKNYIDTVINNLKNQDRLETVDLGALRMLASNYEKYLQAEAILAKDGLVVQGQRVIAPHPMIRVSKDAQNLCLEIMKNFGLTLKSRTNLKAIDGGEDDSPLTQYLKKNAK